ncbi:MAG: phosphatidylglycerophosphatase A [Magnetococcus sp. YQC-5]
MESSTKNSPFIERLALKVATVGGVGYIPWAPGTFGTLAAVPLAWLAQQWGGGVAEGVVLLLVSGIGTWAADVSCRILGRKDPSEVVIDEVAGLLLAMMFASQGWIWFVVGFALFRLFDIWKPWPVHALERLPGGWGVMADDWAAGIYAGLFLLLLARFLEL